jgi:hypothetical protein
MNAILSPETVMACAIVSLDRQKEPIKIETISRLFVTLRQEKVNEVGEVALRRLPNGIYSEDVEAFFGRLLAGGFATARSPLDVKKEGIDLCLELIDEERKSHPKAFEKMAQTLHFNVAYFSGQG